MASFQSNPTTTILSAYSPTSDATEEVMQNFYESLSDVIQSVPAHNFLAVLGDFNGRFGTDNVPHSYHQKTNSNGQHLIDLLEEHALLAVNTRFLNAENKLWT